MGATGGMVRTLLSRIKAGRDVNLTQNLVLPGAPEVAFPVFSVPLADKGARFWARKDLLADLGARLAGEAATVTLTLAGTGGVGKSQLAAQVAYRSRHRLEVVWWVSCATDATEEALAPAALARAGLAALGTRLGLAPGDDPAASAARVRGWLEHSEHPWLLVFDDVAEPAVLDGLVPQAGPGLVLITSRNRLWDGEVVDVEGFDLDSAAGFLQARSGLVDPTGARRLAGALGGLALALEQAGAFLAQARPVRMGFSTYLAELERRGLAVFEG